LENFLKLYRPQENTGYNNMKQTMIRITLICSILLIAITASAERRYSLEEVEITIPDNWIDIDSQTEFLNNEQLIAAYTNPLPGGSLPLIRILDIAAPGNERGMLTFSIRPCYRGECPSQTELQSQSKTGAHTEKNQKLITDDGSQLLENYGTAVSQGCGGYFASQGQKVKLPFGGVFISKSKTFYKDSYAIDVSAGYAEAASDDVIDRIEAALQNFKCTADKR
jgi:hypothetical protein